MTDLSILGCYAHPDDEQGIVGTLRQSLEQNIRVALLCATRGEVGEISDPSLATPETLGEVREQELRRAAKVVGIDQLYFLDYRDSGMDGTPENKDPRAFINANDEEAIGRIVKVIRGFKPTVIVTFDETGGYGHPDHLAIYKWTTEAFSAAGDPARYPGAGAAFKSGRLYYSSFPRSLIKKMAEAMKQMDIQSVFSSLSPDKYGLDDELITNRVKVTEYTDMKRTAMLEHKTQINPNGPFSRFSEEAWAEFRSQEYFAYAAGVPIPAGADPSDLFAGLR